MKQKERSREEIYQAALTEFGANGYDRTNMEAICSRHGISKGMMYHYYSNKDELFLLCVSRTFSDLKISIEEAIPQLTDKAVSDAVKGYFMLRESYFQDHPKQKMVFECALLRPPAHLTGQIHQLHMPLQKLNHQFLAQQLERMPLRPGLCREKAMRYLESVEYYFSSALGMYCNHQNAADLHGMLEGAGELLDMILFGVAR